MKDTRLLMGMPITVEILDSKVDMSDIDEIYSYFKSVDDKFSTYKDSSEISFINRGLIKPAQYSQQMREVLELCKKTKEETGGYFNIERDGKLDPSGVVKGWAILNAAKLIKERGFTNFYIEAGGDIQVGGVNSQGSEWVVGIENPFNRKEVIKKIYLKHGVEAVATSGTYIRGKHIYNPHSKNALNEDIISLCVIGENILDVDRFVTAAFAMGPKGLEFIENLKGFEGYMIDKNKIARFTSGFSFYSTK